MPPIPTTLPFLLFTALMLGTGVMRLVELAISVRRIQGKPEAAVSEPALFPLMALLHAGLVFAPLAEVIGLGRPFVPALGAAAVATLVLATALRVWTLYTVRRAWNVRVVKPDAANIVTTGPYAFIRHPNYLVVILEIAALPLVHNAWLAAIGLSLLNGFVLFWRIRTEEAMLGTIPAWREAFAQRARLIPGLL